MGISIAEARKNNLISDKTLSLLNTKCICGHELEFTDSLKRLKCANSKCKANILNRCRTFCNILNINITDEELIKLQEKLNIITPYQLLMLDDVQEQNGISKYDIHELDSCIQTIKSVKQDEYFIYQIIELSGIQEISCIAKKLFYGFNSVHEIFDEIEASRVIFFNERLGIRSSDSTILSVEIYNRIMALQEELIFAETLFNIKKYNNILRVVFADNNVGEFLNKSELIEYIENRYKYTILHLSSISNNIDILIKNGATSNTKYRTAVAINERFIADQINSGKLDLDDVGKVEEDKLKPVGSIIYIDNLENVLNRLDSITGDS